MNEIPRTKRALIRFVRRFDSHSFVLEHTVIRVVRFANKLFVSRSLYETFIRLGIILVSEQNRLASLDSF